MEASEIKITLKQLVTQFGKIRKYLNKKQLAKFEEILQDLVPGTNSEVFMAPGSDDSDNSVVVSVYVKNPVKSDTPVPFDKLMYEWLLLTDLERIERLGKCVNRMEARGIDKYNVHFTSVDYNDLIGDYTINFRIMKKLN